MEIKKQLNPSDLSSTADTLNNIGLVYKSQGKYEEALKYLIESVEMKKQALPANDSIGTNIYFIVFYLYIFLILYFSNSFNRTGIKHKHSK